MLIASKRRLFVGVRPEDFEVLLVRLTLRSTHSRGDAPVEVAIVVMTRREREFVLDEREKILQCVLAHNSVTPFSSSSDVLTRSRPVPE